MANFSKLVAALIVSFGCVSAARAGFAQVSPPPGWSSGASAGSSGLMRAGAAAANEAVWAAGTVRTAASLSVGGTITKVPVTMRFAANAGRFAARAMFTNPLLLAGAIAAPFAIQWALTQGYFIQDGKWMRQEETCQDGQCFMYQIEGYGLYSSPNGACQGMKKYYKGVSTPESTTSYSLETAGLLCKVYETATYPPSPQYNRSHFLIGQYTINKVQVDGVLMPRPATQEEFEDDLAPQPMPVRVPVEIDYPVPVDDPIINPSPALQPQPLRIPQGSPQPVPDTNPQEYKQPFVRIDPANTPANPWRVSVTPEDVTGTDPNGQPDPETPTDPATPRDPAEAKDLCLEHPDIIACQKIDFDTPDGPDLPTKDVSITMTPDNGWGASSAACPAARHITVQGRDIPIPFDLFCTYMEMIRPLIIAFAWLSAAYILIGAREGD